MLWLDFGFPLVHFLSPPPLSLSVLWRAVALPSLAYVGRLLQQNFRGGGAGGSAIQQQQPPQQQVRAYPANIYGKFYQLLINYQRFIREFWSWVGK